MWRSSLREVTAADGTAVDAVHHQAVVDQRRVRLLDAVQDDLPAGVGDRPGRSGEQREEPAEAVEHDLAVRARVGDPGVLDERAVGVEAVALGDVREDRREGVPGEGDLGRGRGRGCRAGRRTRHRSTRLAPVLVPE